MAFFLTIVLLINFFLGDYLFFLKSKAEKPKFGKPVARIGEFSVDLKGQVRRVGESENLPQIVVLTEPLFGNERIENYEFNKILFILDRAEKSELDVEKIAVYNKERIDFYLKNGIMVTVNSELDADYFISSLQIMLSRFKIEGKVPASIDYRFNKPVVKF